MPALRWTLPVILLIAVAALAGPRIFKAPDESVGTLSAEAAEQFHAGSDHLRRLEIEAARTSLEAAIEADPDFAMAHFELGHALLWLNEREAGRKEMIAADSLAHVPGATTELERLVIGQTAARLLDDEARAEDYLDELARKYAGHPLTLRIQAQRALQDGDSVRARQLYMAVLDADPDRVEIHNTLGYMALQEGQYEDAVASFKRYAYFAGDAANPHDSLGEAFMWTGRYHESVEQYSIALEIDPSFLSSVIGASDALAVTGQFELARKFLDKFEELFKRRNQWGTREIKLLQVAYQAEEWERVVTNVQRLRADDGFATYEPGLRLWSSTLGAIAMAELGRYAEADTLVAEVEETFDYFLGEVEEVDVREDLQLLRASLRCRMALIRGEAAAHELAALRGLIEASTHKPHRLLPYQGVLIQSLHEAGLDAEALQFAPQVLGFNPNHPRTLLVCAQAEKRMRNRDAALAYLERYLDVMREADETHPRVRLARQLHTKLSPSS